ncbi:hypothetical protein GCM10028775_47590 [Catellatospora paridis]
MPWIFLVAARNRFGSRWPFTDGVTRVDALAVDPQIRPVTVADFTRPLGVHPGPQQARAGCSR